MAYLDELATRSGDIDIHAADERGRADLASRIAETPPDSKLYVCGPARLLDAVTQLTLTWKPGWVRMERFTAREHGAPARTTPFEIELRDSGITLTVQPDTSVADAIRSTGVKLLTSCGRGVCGTCETTVIDGTPDHRDSLLEDEERAANTCMFPCVSRSRSDHLTLAL